MTMNRVGAAAKGELAARDTRRFAPIHTLGAEVHLAQSLRVDLPWLPRFCSNRDPASLFARRKTPWRVWVRALPILLLRMTV